MRRNLKPEGPGGGDFLDGYIFRFLQERLAAGTPAETGLYAYYAGRVTGRTGGVADYEDMVVRVMLNRIPAKRHILHVGIGLGTTTALLAAAGRRVGGVEADPKRFALAAELRDGLVSMWPTLADGYTLFPGRFPAMLPAVAAHGFIGGNAVILFTNFQATLAREDEDRALCALRGYADAILDLRLFGAARETDAERDALRERIVTLSGLCDAGSLVSGHGVHYWRFSAA